LTGGGGETLGGVAADSAVLPSSLRYLRFFFFLLDDPSGGAAPVDSSVFLPITIGAESLLSSVLSLAFLGHLGDVLTAAIVGLVDTGTDFFDLFGDLGDVFTARWLSSPVLAASSSLVTDGTSGVFDFLLGVLTFSLTGDSTVSSTCSTAPESSAISWMTSNFLDAPRLFPLLGGLLGVSA
jgi:hypothetical protein